jgi:uncharacterized protein
LSSAAFAIIGTLSEASASHRPHENKSRNLGNLAAGKTELVRRLWLKRLALFGSYAHEDQREDSDVDILMEIESQIGLGFVELVDRIEDALGIRMEVVSRRAIKPRYWEIIKEDLVVSRRTTPLWKRLRKSNVT